MSYLIAKSDDGRLVRVPLREPAEIGREDRGWTVVVRTRNHTVSLGISDATVSKTHARIYPEFGKMMLEDLGSTNGTLLNNHPLPGWQPGRESESVDIGDNSQIQFGQNTMVSISLGEMTLTKDEWDEIRNKHPSREADRLTNCFRIIMEIRDERCSTDVKARTLLNRLTVLKKYLADDDDFLDEIEKIQRKIQAELSEDEYLGDEHVEELRNFCVRASETWLAKLLR